ncbi:MAG: hypothetical protein ACLFMS_02795 [Halorhodospira sp.]
MRRLQRLRERVQRSWVLAWLVGGVLILVILGLTLLGIGRMAGVFRGA